MDISDIIDTLAIPHVPYWRKVKAHIVVYGHRVHAIRTGVRYKSPGKNAYASHYFIAGLVLRIPSDEVEGRWTRNCRYMKITEFTPHDLIKFYSEFKQTPEYEEYMSIRRLTLEGTPE